MLKVLLVEENPEDYILLHNFLDKDQRAQFEVTVAEILEDALMLLHKEHFDVILLDLDLPENQRLKNLKKIYATVPDIPIIVLTNTETEQTALSALTEGAEEYLLKNDTTPNLLARTIRYVVERKQAEQEKMRLIASLHESEERFRLMANSAPVLIWISGLDGKFIFFNQHWLDFTGKGLEKELGNGWLEGVKEEDREKFLDSYHSALNKREPFQVEYRLLRSDGDYRWVLNTGVPRFSNQGKFNGYIGSCIDISERKQAEEYLYQQTTRERLIAKITREIHASTDLNLNNILTTSVKEINHFLEADRLVIFKIDGNDGDLWESVFAERISICVQLSRALEQLPDLDDDLARLNGEQSLVIDRLQEYEDLDNEFILKQKRLGIRSLLMLPIVFQQQLWGWICAQQWLKDREWQSFEIELMQQLSIQLASAIQKAELHHKLNEAYQELETVSIVDSLTGIANRRKFDDYLNAEWRRLAREKASLSIILCDIDYFKLYNDTYGHQAGDSCLQRVARAMQNTIKRPADLVARYGGEEFAVILPNTPGEGALKVAQSICDRVRDLQIEHVKSLVNRYVTMSFGVASCIPNRDIAPEDAIQAADQGLYRAKETGRDRVIFYNPLINYNNIFTI
jgi:diguanylate cyclase (GGDEF)-like protein/PAS domain S-box-containing protein